MFVWLTNVIVLQERPMALGENYQGPRVREVCMYGVAFFYFREQPFHNNYSSWLFSAPLLASLRLLQSVDYMLQRAIVLYSR